MSMSVIFRPAVREDTPLIVGIAGPTKSGKTYSAHRIAIGLAGGKSIGMINAEGKRGHQYADKFNYLACDIEQPFRPQKYEDAVNAVRDLNLGCLIIDSMSHMHDGPGGMLEWHNEEAKKISGRKEYSSDREREKAEERATWTAWIDPKAAENRLVYTMLGLDIPIVLCFRAKEKMRIVSGRQPIDLGWQPISSERVAFETLFTLILPPHSKGVPDLSISEMREPFDTMVPQDRPINEALGEKLAQWSRGRKIVITEDQVRACKTPDELASLWNSLSIADKKRLSTVKDEVKAKLGAEVRNKSGDFLATAIAHVKAGRFDEARDLKVHVSENNQKFIEEEIEAMQGVHK